jgi:predicted nucleic acid-binding protein
MGLEWRLDPADPEPTDLPVGGGAMTRFVVDAGVVLRLVAEGAVVSEGHGLLAPTLIRSETLSLLHEAVERGEISADTALERHESIGKLKIRLLGDAVLLRTAWKVADKLGWSAPYKAEYIALRLLQADACVTLDTDLAHRVDGIVRTASFDALSG